MATEKSKPEPASPPAAPAIRFPTTLLAAWIGVQWVALFIGAFPEWTMRQDQPSDAWLYLAGAQGMFLSWLWPISRLGRPAVAMPIRQGLTEAFLLALAATVMVVPAVWWVNASWRQVLAPAAYLAIWLVGGAIFVALADRSDRLAGVARWAYAVLTTAANFLLPAMGYVDADFFGGRVDPWARLSPVCNTARLSSLDAAEPLLATMFDRLAFSVPAALVLLLVAVMLTRRTKPINRLTD